MLNFISYQGFVAIFYIKEPWINCGTILSKLHPDKCFS